MVQLKESRADLGDVNFYWALSRAGLAGQAAGHCIVDLMGEVFVAAACIAPTTW
ncbi:hypothetical protein D9M68_444290 [compost metagenome]